MTKQEVIEHIKAGRNTSTKIREFVGQRGSNNDVCRSVNRLAKSGRIVAIDQLRGDRGLPTKVYVLKEDAPKIVDKFQALKDFKGFR